MNPEKRESSLNIPLHATFADKQTELSEEELLLKITRERGLLGETVAGIVGMIQHGVALHHEK